MHLFDRLHAGGGPVMLLKDVVANRIHEGPKPVGLADSAFGSQCPENADKGLLAQVLDRPRVQTAGAELNAQELREIGDKVHLRRRVAFAEAPDVRLVKRIEFHWSCPEPGGGKYSRPRTERQCKGTHPLNDFSTSCVAWSCSNFVRAGPVASATQISRLK